MYDLRFVANYVGFYSSFSRALPWQDQVELAYLDRVTMKVYVVCSHFANFMQFNVGYTNEMGYVLQYAPNYNQVWLKKPLTLHLN